MDKIFKNYFLLKSELRKKPDLWNLHPLKQRLFLKNKIKNIFGEYNEEFCLKFSNSVGLYDSNIKNKQHIIAYQILQQLKLIKPFLKINHSSVDYQIILATYIDLHNNNWKIDKKEILNYLESKIKISMINENIDKSIKIVNTGIKAAKLYGIKINI